MGLRLGLSVDELENITPRANDTLDNSFSLSTPITLLGLSRRSTNALDKRGIKNLQELLQLQRKDVEAIPNLGIDSVSEISSVFRMHGLRLGMKLSSDLNSGETRISSSIPDTFSIPPGFKSVSLQQLGFSLRTINCLKSVDITNGFDLASRTFSYFAHIPKMGKKSLSEIEASLTALYEACDSSGKFLS
jgi:DNA-directed RNA polymerase alpha subunit